nr:hypothetical protein [Marinitoga lauensis]
MKDKVEKMGQVFTPNNIVKKMVDLIKYGKNILEPSAGKVHF